MAKHKPKAQEPEVPPLRLEWVEADSLEANPANWRRHPDNQAAALKDALGEVGWAGALLLNEQTGRLIDGHLRKKVASGQMVPVLVGSWTEEQEKKILATLDPIAAMAVADRDSLDALLRDVQTGSEALAGMLTELAEQAGIVPSLNGQAPAEDAGPQVDRAAELLEKWQVEKGSLWLIPSKASPGGVHRLLCGDSTVPQDVARVMGGQKAGLMNTDPPYGVAYEGGRNPQSNVPRERLAGDGSTALYARCLNAALLFPSAPVYLWFADRAGEPVYQAVHNAGYKVRAMIVWNKMDAHYGNFMAQYMQKHEPCLYCVKGSPQWIGPTNEVTVWDVKQPTVNEYHPTQKPVELFARPINNHLKPGEIAYEPFAGSGSQFIAAEQTGRLCYGIELEPKYVAVCLERLEALGLQPRLSDG